MREFNLILIVGENESGKTTFAEALGEALGWTVGETSRVLDEPLAKLLAAEHEGAFGPTTITLEQRVARFREIVQANKSSYRKMKRMLGDVIRDIEPGWMV